MLLKGDVILQLELELQPKTEKKLRTVLAQHPDQETFVQSIIAYQIAELKRAILNIRLDLQQFERKYQQSTEHFYDLFNLNQLDDSEDYMIWAGIYELLRNNEEQLAVLT